MYMVEVIKKQKLIKKPINMLYTLVVYFKDPFICKNHNRLLTCFRLEINFEILLETNYFLATNVY
jgi:hypothetical protein